jgi:TolA-binding protein/HEAT repeat protein
MRHHLSFALLLAATPMIAQPTPPVPPVRPVPAPRPAPLVRPLLRYGPDYEDRVREMADRAAEMQERAQERAQEAQQRAQERAQENQQRALERAQEARDRALETQQRAFERTQQARERAFDYPYSFRSIAPIPPLPPLPPLPPVPPVPPVPPLAPMGPMGLVGPSGLFYSYGHTLPERPPAPWAQNDPADSLYKAAQQALSRGDYRKAAAAFKEIPQRFQYSAYAEGAMYWQAHSLYRIGSTPDLQEALGVLETLKQKYPGSRNGSRRGGGDVNELATRIAGVLSTRGLGNNDAVKRVLTEAGGNTCDTEEQGVRAQALSALMETDPDAAAQLAQKMLAKKDECSVSLRRNAVMIAARRHDAQTLATLTSVAKNDPSSDVRQSAVRYLAGMPGDEALSALEELLKSSDDPNVQREAVRSLARHSSPRARLAARAIIERNDASESLRISALGAFDRDRSTTDDSNWLRSIYPKVDNPRVKSEIVQAIARIGGDGLDQWFLTLAKNENASIEERNSAVRRAAQTMDIPSLGRFYDAVAIRQLRSTVIDALGNRREPDATDKLAEIVKSGTDPELRSQAIRALSRKDNDPRARKALLDLVDRPEKP